MTTVLSEKKLVEIETHMRLRKTLVRDKNQQQMCIFFIILIIFYYINKTDSFL